MTKSESTFSLYYAYENYPNPSAAQKGIRVSHHSSNRRPERAEDSILIDEARTPLIISESVPAVPRQFEAGREVANALKKDLHYTVDEKNMNATQPYIFLADISYDPTIVGSEYSGLLDTAWFLFFFWTARVSEVVMTDLGEKVAQDLLQVENLWEPEAPGPTSDECGEDPVKMWFCEKLFEKFMLGSGYNHICEKNNIDESVLTSQSDLWHPAMQWPCP